MPKTSVFTILLATLFLGGCSVLGPGQAQWSEELPSQAFFEQRYAEDTHNQAQQSPQDYYTWVQRFYQGMNMIPGWLHLSEDLLSRVPPEQQDSVQAQLVTLGREISAEWAKDNAVRRIDNRMVSVWRDALIQAVNQNEVPAYLSEVQVDVRALLYQDLAGEAIYYERYYEDDFEF